MAEHRLKIQGQQKRKEILDFMRKYQAENGYLPTNPQIGKAVGLAPVTVKMHLRRLVKEGKIQPRPPRRTLVITDDPADDS